MKRSNKLKQLSSKESCYLNGVTAEMQSKSNDYSAAKINESHLPTLSEGILISDYKWLSHDVNLIIASTEKYGDIATTSIEVQLNGALAPNDKKRYAYLHMFWGATCKGATHMSQLKATSGCFIGLTSRLQKLLGFKQGWHMFVNQLVNKNMDTGNSYLADYWRSGAEIAKAFENSLPSCMVKLGKENFPDTTNDYGLHIYFHSAKDDMYYGPVSYDFAETSQLKYPDETSKPMELPGMCDRIAILWKNDRRNDTENGLLCGKISFMEAN